MKNEVIVIGCGAAGLSAAIFLARHGVKTFVVGRPENSQLNKASGIENYFGFPDGVTGEKLLDLGIEQAKKFGAERVGFDILDIRRIKNDFEVELNNNEKFSASFLVFATGTPKKSVEGEVIEKISVELGIKTKNGLFVVDENNRTNLDRVFAAGGCASSNRQIAKAVGDGCNAAVEIIKEMKKKDLYLDYGSLSK